MTKLVEDGKVSQKVVKDMLDFMARDIAEAQNEMDQKNEPETRVKIVVNRSVASKFTDVLRLSQ